MICRVGFWIKADFDKCFFIKTARTVEQYMSIRPKYYRVHVKFVEFSGHNLESNQT
jgi:hypothetical protein